MTGGASEAPMACVSDMHGFYLLVNSFTPRPLSLHGAASPAGTHREICNSLNFKGLIVVLLLAKFSGSVTPAVLRAVLAPIPTKLSTDLVGKNMSIT